jgi:structure-specific recognition protein 1
MPSHDGHPNIKANLKAVQGDLFMLEKYVFFVSKQPVLIELSDIHQVLFSRLGQGMGASASRTFDLKITTKSGPEYVFSSINKEEKDNTEAYLKDKKVRVKSEKMPEAEIMLDVDDEDEEMASIASDSGGEAPKARTGGDDDESEEGTFIHPFTDYITPTESLIVDEDFRASGSDSGSPTDTDSDGEGGATASDASGDRDIARGGKKKVVKKKQKAKVDGDDEGGKKTAKKPRPKKEDDDDDAMDVDDDHPKDKPQPKPKAKAKVKEGEQDEPAKKKVKVATD